MCLSFSPFLVLQRFPFLPRLLHFFVAPTLHFYEVSSLSLSLPSRNVSEIFFFLRLLSGVSWAFRPLGSISAVVLSKVFFSFFGAFVENLSCFFFPVISAFNFEGLYVVFCKNNILPDHMKISRPVWFLVQAELLRSSASVCLDSFSSCCFVNGSCSPFLLCRPFAESVMHLISCF